MNRKILITLLILVPALVVLVVAVSKSDVLTGRAASVEQSSEQVEARQVSFAAYDSVQLDPISQVESPLEISEIFIQDLSNIPEAHRDDAQEIYAYLAELIYLRFIEQDPDQYRQAQLDRGYRMISHEEAVNRLYIGFDYELLFEEPFPQDPDALLDVYRRLWSNTEAFQGMASLTPEQLPSDAVGVGIAFGELCNSNPSAWPLVSDELSTEDWYGRTSSSFRRWFHPPFGEWLEYLGQQGCLEVANVNVLFQVDRDERYAMNFTFVQDNSSNPRWWHVGVGVHNAEYDRFRMQEW